MISVVETLAFQLYLMACCLFAPANQKEFQIELREGQRTEGVVMYVERTDAGFAIYGSKDKKGDCLSVRKAGERYAVVVERGGQKTEFVIDNAKVGIVPLDKDGKYIKEINGQKVTFELKGGVRKVYQEDNDKLFLILMPAPSPSSGSTIKVPAGWIETTGTIKNVTPMDDGSYAFTLVYVARQSMAIDADGKKINGEIPQHHLGVPRKPVEGQVVRLKYMADEPIMYQLIDEIQYVQSAGAK